MLLRVLALVALVALMAEGTQRRFRQRRFEPPEALEPTIVPSFSFARVRFQSYRSGWNPGWAQ